MQLEIFEVSNMDMCLTQLGHGQGMLSCHTGETHGFSVLILL